MNIIKKLFGTKQPENIQQDIPQFEREDRFEHTPPTDLTHWDGAIMHQGYIDDQLDMIIEQLKKPGIIGTYDWTNTPEGIASSREFDRQVAEMKSNRKRIGWEKYQEAKRLVDNYEGKQFTQIVCGVPRHPED